MKWFKKKKIIIPLGVLLFLVALRIALQPFLLGFINKKLATFSPEIEGHVDGLNIGIFRGAFGVEDMTMKLKKNDKEFLQVKEADVSLAWREIFKGNLMADAMVNGVTFTFDERIPAAIKKSLPPEDKSAPKKQPPLRISRLDWKNVDVILPTDKAYTNQGPFRLSGIEGRVTNLFADSDTPRSFFHVLGKGSGTSSFKAIGSANLLADPLEWDVDAQMQGFTLSSMNRFLLNKVPLTFTKGIFDLYSEVKSEEGKIRGYVKPFVEDLDFIRRDENFKGAKHWLIEVAGAVGNWILEAKRDRTIATKVPFSFDGKKFAIDQSAAVSNVIEHGFDQELSPGVDGNMSMQAQEAKNEAKETERDNEKKEDKKED
ncbi:MAG: DUF748 domain-containing protein [Bdellovibrionota bacterium]